MARRALNRDEGRCTPASLLFVADRLMDRGGDAEALEKPSAKKWRRMHYRRPA